jgi:magnesium-transporting ATPase (P-type)
MASRGLRTLVFGIRELSGIIDVDSLKPEDVEHNITLLGATAVEDLLQDDVQRCI